MNYFINDGIKIYYRKWDIPRAKSVVFIVHGMVEHISRYEGLANYLNSKGYSVLGMDLRGHGQTGLENGLGEIAPSQGWEVLIGDMRKLFQIEKKKYPNLDFIGLGHSMGSYLLRDYINSYPQDLAAAIIMGTGAADKFDYKLARFLLKFLDGDKEARLMTRLSFGGFNKTVENPKTAYDWLSRDPKEVEKYMEDSLCGFIPKNSFYRDFMDGMKKVAEAEKDISYRRPVLFLSGEKDPVGDMSRSVKEVYDKYIERTQGDLILYDGMRHEILNELNRHYVYQDIESFLAEIG